MKKIITLLFSVGAFATSFAQYNHQQNNNDRNARDNQYANSANGNRDFDNGRKDWGRSNKGNNYSRERDFQIEKINLNFNRQVQAIQSDRHLRRREKKAAIRNAEIQRSRQIQMVNERFTYNNNRKW